MTYAQHALGTFIVELEGPNHCGPVGESPREFNYEVYAQFLDCSLDSRGMLIDNLDFQRYFDSIGSTRLSCELLARQSAEYFVSLQAGCFEITVGLWGIPNRAKVSATILRKLVEVHSTPGAGI